VNLDNSVWLVRERKKSQVSKKWLSEKYGVSIDKNCIFHNKIELKLFYTYNSDGIVLGESLQDLVEVKKTTISKDSTDFYNRFGFIYPPYTVYEDIFVLTPYMRVSVNLPSVERLLNYPTVDQSFSLKDVEVSDLIKKHIQIEIAKSAANKLILFSGGIDSSVILGIVNEQEDNVEALTCHMPSFSSETTKSKSMCSEIQIPHEVIHIKNDLSQYAIEFLEQTLEPISDKISPVFGAILDSISPNKAKKSFTIIDGQGADSLFCGLPHDKVYDFYKKAEHLPFRNLLSYIPSLPRSNNNFRHILYRICKALRALRFETPVEMLIDTLVENSTTSICNENNVLVAMRSDLEQLNNRFDSFHLVIKYIFMFKILPCREMQKYDIARRKGFSIALPFLSPSFVEQCFYIDDSLLIRSNNYKYPMYKLAKKYWPSYFDNSKTSPFSIPYEVNNQDIRIYSLNKLQEIIDERS
jgi:asparagine synthetase B (glutamine-hydrolysing)